MKKLVKIRCGSCGHFFLPKSQKNIYCKRSCFKKAYYYQRKAKELTYEKKFPSFKCPSCQRNIKLDFDPTVNEKLWFGFSCPYCKILMISVFEEIITLESSTT
jgi:hypothetical protein